MTTSYSKKQLASMKALFQKSTYIKKEWKTTVSMTLNEYAELIDPTFKKVESAEIISKERKDGGLFLKMQFTLQGGGIAEFDLPYGKNWTDEEIPDYEEGDEIDINTLTFGIEKDDTTEKEHAFAAGMLAE